MFKYVIQDLAGTVRYIPYGILIGLFLMLVVQGINIRRKKKGKAPLRRAATVCFFAYLGLIIVITFLSREGGSTTGLDLEIGSSLRINTRNDAYAVENVLLFIPYGFCFTWYRNKKGFFWSGFLSGFWTSLIIELMQLLTGRGVFQIDDIVTNTLGCVLGAVVFKIVQGVFRGNA